LNTSEKHNDFSDERQWIEDSKKDIKYFEPIYERYYNEIFRYIYRRTANFSTANELCSNTFYKALVRIKKFKWRNKPFGYWLYRVATNEIRKHAGRRKVIFVFELDRISTEIPELEHESIPAEQRLQKVLKTLSATELRLIELKYFEGYTFSKISLLLDISESAVKMRTYRLLERMKEHMKAI